MIAPLSSRRLAHLAVACAFAGAFGGCASAAPAKTAPAPVDTSAAANAAITIDRKMAWIIRLEQQRALRDGTRRPDATVGARTLVAATTPDLEALAIDLEGAVRRRAVIAIGRVGNPDAIPTLVAALSDVEEEVRASAAFSLGQLGVAEAVAPLLTALRDASLVVRGRAIEGLGLLGPTLASTAGPAIDAASLGCRDRLVAIEPDDEAYPKTAAIEACRLALYAFARLRYYDGIARIALADDGQPASHWWPVAYALQRLNDPRAAPTLLALASTPGVTTASFAIRGLAALHDAHVVPIAQALALRPAADVRLRVVAVRALGQTGGPAAFDVLSKLLDDPSTPRNLQLEAVSALGATGSPRAFDRLLDHITESWTTLRAAVFGAAAKASPDGFLLVMSSMPPDRDWSVRSALAPVLATLPADRVRDAIEDLVGDADARVRGPALEALAVVGAPDLAARLFASLEAPDFAERTTAAKILGDKKPEGGVSRLTAALTRASSDATPAARIAAIDALAKYGGDAAKATIHLALGDPEWPVRRRAADLLRTMGEVDARPLLPAPTRQPIEFFESAALLHPAYSPHAFIETRGGTIEIELNVVDTPVTTSEFIALARAGFYNGVKIHRLVPNFVVQAGDPRGDGEGGPGYTIRDELSPRPFLRGSVGIALDGPDTGGSQFFITVSPQPHLDGKYTLFGQVVKGAELLDRLSQGDVIERVRIWDGVSLR